MRAVVVEKKVVAPGESRKWRELVLLLLFVIDFDFDSDSDSDSDVVVALYQLCFVCTVQ